MKESLRWIICHPFLNKAEANEFIRGAKENGHEIFRFDAAHSNAHPCIACNKCEKDGPCIFNNDFQKVREHILPADLVVFVASLYGFGICVQLKNVIDRFYALDKKFHVPRQAILLSTDLNTADKPIIPLAMTYQAMLHYLSWCSSGIIQAGGLDEAGAIKDTKFPELACMPGKNIRD